MSTKVAVVGAGIMGLSVAYHLIDKFGDKVSVTVIADKFSPDTCSDKAGAIMIPIDFASAKPGAGTDVRARQWTTDTFSLLDRLYRSEVAGEIDLCLLAGYDYKYGSYPEPWWKELVFGFRKIASTSQEAQMLHLPQSCKTVWAFTTYMLNCRCYLPWLMRRFVERGGTVKQGKLSSLDMLNTYDIIVNCTGLGAIELVGDRDLRPVRGQGVLVKAPWIKHFIINYTDKESLTYILPRGNDVLLGGTAQDDNFDNTADPATSEVIKSRCMALVPSLCKAEVIGSWAGGRPVLDTVRLEEERREGKPPVIHCYGHGGQGIVLHWGCALEVGRMVERHVMPIASRSHL